MRHLNPETLARIADGPATRAERSHLDGCAACTAEVAVFRDQIETLATLADPIAPRELWSQLEGELPSFHSPGRSTGGRDGLRSPVRAAAALALFLAGVATGFGLDRGSAVHDPGIAKSDPVPDAVEIGDRPDPESIAAPTVAGVQQAPDLIGGTIDPARRLAALESILATARAALDVAPDDPVIDRYRRSAMEERSDLIRRAGLTDDLEEWY